MIERYFDKHPEISLLVVNEEFSKKEWFRQKIVPNIDHDPENQKLKLYGREIILSPYLPKNILPVGEKVAKIRDHFGDDGIFVSYIIEILAKK